MSQAGRFLFGGGAGGPVDTLTGDGGGPVGPIMGNINIAGGHDINTVGNPGTATITVNVDNVITLGDLVNVAGTPSLTLQTGNAVITAGNLQLPNTTAADASGEIQLGGFRFLSNYGANNTFLGETAGNTTLTVGNAIDNVGIGTDVLLNVTTGAQNVGVGSESLGILTTSGSNTAIGFNALGDLVNVATPLHIGRNVAVGAEAGAALINGDNNIFVGFGAGDTYTTNESSNIIIGNPGFPGESNVIRIGTPEGIEEGQQDKCYIAGIDGVTPDFPNSCDALYIAQNHQLGSSSIDIDGGLLIGANGSQPIGGTLTAGGGITITNAPNSITISATGTVTTSYNTDSSGPAVPIAGVLNVFGVHGINTDTVAPGNTIDIAIDNVITLGDLASVAGAAALTLTTGNAVITAGNLTLPNTTAGFAAGTIKLGGTNFVSNYGNNNTFLGEQSGNTTLTVIAAQGNVGVGTDCLINLTTGANNTGAGFIAFQLLGSGSNNCAYGENSMGSATSAGTNSAYGSGSLDSLVSGTGNLALGYLSGSNYTTTESNNITLANNGVIADNFTIRIGTQGTQTKTFIAGTYNTAATGTTTADAAYINQLGQVGSSQLNDGYVLIGATGANPVGAALTAGFGVTITNAANSITIASSGSGGGLPWTDVFGAQAMLPNNGYVSDSGATITFTLPATANFGDVMRIVGKGAGGWTLAQNAGQIIIFGVQSTTIGVGGSLASTLQSDCVELLCTTGGANTFWTVISCIGNITVV